MDKNSIKKEHQDAKSNIEEVFIRGMENSPDPFTALDKLSDFDSIKICAIIDLMSRLGGVFILGAIKLRIEDSALPQTKRELYQLVIQRAEKLSLDATKGFGYAWKNWSKTT